MRKAALRVRTIDVEDVVVVGLAHRVGRHAAVRPVVGLVEVFDEQVGARDDGVGRDVVVHLHPVDLLGPGEGRGSSFNYTPNLRLPDRQL